MAEMPAKTYLNEAKTPHSAHDTHGHYKKPAKSFSIETVRFTASDDGLPSS